MQLTIITLAVALASASAEVTQCKGYFGVAAADATMAVPTTLCTDEQKTAAMAAGEACMAGGVTTCTTRAPTCYWVDDCAAGTTNCLHEHVAHNGARELWGMCRETNNWVGTGENEATNPRALNAVGCGDETCVDKVVDCVTDLCNDGSHIAVCAGYYGAAAAGSTIAIPEVECTSAQVAAQIAAGQACKNSGTEACTVTAPTCVWGDECAAGTTKCYSEHADHNGARELWGMCHEESNWTLSSNAAGTGNTARTFNAEQVAANGRVYDCESDFCNRAHPDSYPISGAASAVPSIALAMAAVVALLA